MSTDRTEPTAAQRLAAALGTSPPPEPPLDQATPDVGPEEVSPSMP